MERKVYISGPITNEPDARKKFKKAENLLMGLGLNPVNPFDNGLPKTASWNDHMIEDLRRLAECDAIFMLIGWESSKGARIEFGMAKEMDMDIMFESKEERERFVGAKNDKFANMVKAAIREVTGIDFDQREVNDRSNKVFYTRMIFTYHCRQIGMTLKQIKTYTHRDHTTMLHYLKRYQDEIKFNPGFRRLAEKVQNIVNNYVSK